MPLVVFDLDGTLLQTTGVDDACFVRAMDDALGIRGFVTDWSDYAHATDTGLVAEIVRRSLGRDAGADDLHAVHESFTTLLRGQAVERPDRFTPVPGAGAMLERVRTLRGSGWSAGLATGAWRASAAIKVAAARLDVADLPAA
ncbi:MAG: haloacid dehalogenase-like hydrolase, partial [Phycisphaerae bacterium]|nr:haloacid dehalogenase-like hydrolase [Phycisphaerae bacterium]